MPKIKLTGKEPPIPLEKAIVLQDFLTITRDIDKALALMRKTCLAGRDVVCATYKDQINHYIRTMLSSKTKGARGPVESMLRRMGEEEYEAVKDIEDLWTRAEKEYLDIVEDEGRAGPEFLEEELIAKWEERLAGKVGLKRWEQVEAIQRGVTGGELKLKPPGTEVEELQEAIKAEEALIESMKWELEEKMKRLKAA